MRILIVDDEVQYSEVMKKIIKKKGYLADTASSGAEALKILKKNKKYDIVLSDLIMNNMDGVSLLEEINKLDKNIKVIMVTGYGSIENAVEAMKKGAYYYFIKGSSVESLLEEIDKINVLITKEREINSNEKYNLKTKNKKFAQTLELAKTAAKSNVNILLLGESGVGKDVFARFIHENSMRKDKEYVAINCCSFSDSLLESELFGHEKGAFTGACDSRKGRFELASGGTLFLDEVGDVSLGVQVKLLRTLENKVVERLGSNKPVEVDFRLISATNKNPKDEILSGTMREDFFYRISTIVITIPPLRERKEDLEDLVKFFLNKYTREFNKEILSIEDDVMEFLLNYDYPGNIRELKNIVSRLVVLSEGEKITSRGLPAITNIHKSTEKEIIRPLREIRKEFECEYIEKALSLCGNNISQAAKKLDISRRQLTNKITEYNIK